MVNLGVAGSNPAVGTCVDGISEVEIETVNAKLGILNVYPRF
jgi:hypothetical protein